MTDALAGFGPVLVIAPHPDDEVLGVGGTMARLSDAGAELHVAIVTTGRAPRFASEQVAAVRAEAKAAHDALGVTETHYLDCPAAELGEYAHTELNAAISAVVGNVAPRTIFAPHPGDIHLDHQLSFLSALVASRPHQQAYPTQIFAYETLSETNWNAPYLTPGFLPNMFIDISDSLQRKLDAFAMFESQQKPPPHERSVASLTALATLRGATVHRRAAEGFVTIRMVV
ncbi:N-acetylglucosaminyl deacetylase, LmbE family [Paracoccus isoporae]|uniref:N-acetylglucosaminyl deacetylase, LmbE family n=1 Tax=Paracoccus isoporae TaxID=591205 RepID=A0A1G6UBR3_9RHOB|nr:PIG-L deacetylase family protein [Paracoccus isoporae]SDD38146.1 N-acetylglucosaminyl deacetylase, LmbE family [Paracoccus isoporae]